MCFLAGMDGELNRRVYRVGDRLFGLLDLLANNEKFSELKQALKIGPDSNLLFFNTEGATDPENYREILWYGKYPSLI